jgi:hypothetical protein
VELCHQHEWTQALVGQFVEIRKGGECLRSGVVDAITFDGSILWLSAEGVWTREMFEKSHGKEVFCSTLPHIKLGSTKRR